MSDLPDSLWALFPHWLAGALAILLVLIYALTKVGGAHDGIKRVTSALTGFLSRRSRENRKRNADVDYQIADLWRQVMFLEEQLAELRLRDEMYWAWILTDQEWHRSFEFAAAENGWRVLPHQSFMEFRDEWIAKRTVRRGKHEGQSPF